MERVKRLASVRPGGSVRLMGDRGYLNTLIATRGALLGLNEIYLEIAPLESEIEQEGLTAKRIETYVDRRFQEAEIKRLSPAELQHKKSGWAALYVHVGIAKGIAEDLLKYYVYSVHVQLHQSAFLVNRSDPGIPVITWWTAGFGSADNLLTIQAQVENLFEEFISDYLAANPK